MEISEVKNDAEPDFERHINIMAVFEYAFEMNAKNTTKGKREGSPKM